METPPFNTEPTRMMTRSVLAEIPTRLGRLSMTDPNNGNTCVHFTEQIKFSGRAKCCIFYIVSM